MWTGILSLLGNILGGPFITAALTAYKAKLASENSQQTLAEQLAASELAVQAKELELQSQYKIAALGRWYEPDHLMGYAVAIYLAKLLVWDKVLGWGITDPLAGWAATTANLVIGFYFGSRTFLNAWQIWRTAK